MALTGTQKLNIEEISWGALSWVNIERPTTREIEYLGSRYGFNAFDLDDCLSRTQLPKIDEYENYHFIILHFPVFYPDRKGSVPSQVSIFVGDTFVVTLHQGELKPLARLFRFCQTSEQARHQNMKSSGYLLYRIIDHLVDYWFPMLNKVLENIDNIEDRVFDEKISASKELSLLRRDIITQRRIIWPMRAVVGSLEGKLRRYVTQDMKVQFGDLTDHLDKIWSTLDECKELIEGLKDSDFLLSTDYINQLVRIMTIVGTTMLPFLVVSGLYGMNVRLPLGNHPFAFLWVLLIMFGFVGSMLLFFRWRKWI